MLTLQKPKIDRQERPIYILSPDQAVTNATEAIAVHYAKRLQQLQGDPTSRPDILLLDEHGSPAR